MVKGAIGISVTIAMLFAFMPFQGCAVTNKKASKYSFGEECAHCHGEKLEGNKNIKKICGGCHDLAPLPVEKMKSEKMRAVVLSEPHVHKARNMFANTPSCFLCHRQTDF